MKRLGVKSFIGSHKKGVIVAAVSFILLLGAILYIAWSMSAWRTYGQAVSETKQDIRNSLDNALKAPSATPQNRTDKLAALTAAEGKINAQKKLCQTHLLVDWQSQWFEAAKKLKTDCAEATRLLESLRADLGHALGYLRDEKKVAEILVSLKTQGEQGENSWKQTRDAWSTSAKKVADLQVGDDFKPVYTLIKERTNLVVTAWQALVASHEAKDRAKYEKSTDDLVKAYGALKSTTEDTSATLLSLEKRLTDSYRAAFN